MSVASKNPFALLDEDGLNPPAPEPAPAATTTTTDQSSTRGGQRGGRGGRGGPGSRGGKYYQRGGARTSAPREGAEDEGADDSAGKKAEFAEGGRGRGRGRGGRGRGDRDGSRGDREGYRGGGGRNRTYDRHSATGKTDSEKKIHQSWGGDEGQKELAAETAAADDAAVEQAAPAGEWGATGGDDNWGAGGDTNTEWGAGGGNNEWGAEGGGGDSWAAPAPTSTNADESAQPEQSDRRPRDRQEEEPDNTLTLDQYLAQQKEKSALIPQLETRKIEKDDSTWKGAKELVKPVDEDVYFVGKTKNAPKARTKKEEKVYLEIDARFERPSRGGRGRGDRGSDRGGRPPRERERGRGQRSNGNTNLDVGDESAFPSLGA